MNKKLERSFSVFYYSDRKRVEGRNPTLTGNCSCLRGDCSGLRGNCSGLRGNCSGLRGDCSGLRGDFDECQLTPEERKKGVRVTELVASETEV